MNSIGDTVLILGILGNEFEYLNNKIGTIEKIFSVSSVETNDYFYADVKVDDSIVPIDLRFLYDINNTELDSVLKSYLLNPIQYYFKVFFVEEQQLVIENSGVSSCVSSISHTNSYEIFDLTSLN